jgi:hypothetical protein
MGLHFVYKRELTVDAQKLRGIIQSDQTALAHYTARRFSDCAQRVNAIAQPRPKVCRLSRLGVIALHRSNRNLATSVLRKLDNAAKTNPLIAEVIAFMNPEANELPDFGIEEIQQALTAPTAFGGVGLTTEEAAPILAASVEPDTTTPLEIENLKEREQWQPLSSAL